MSFKLKENEIISFLKLKPSGNRGWFLGDCVFCKKEKHLGVIFGENLSSYKCFKCESSGTLFSLLKEVNRLDLVESYQTFDREVVTLKRIELQKSKDLDYSLTTDFPPIGWKRIYSDPYLESRGFNSNQFVLFPVGVTKLHPRFKNDYVVFLVEVEGKCVGYIARSRKEKAWIKQYNLSVKEHNRIVKETGIGEYKREYLRYDNSTGLESNKILFGSDSATKKTKTVILVEGITDKFNVDRLLNLYNQEEVVCLSKLGKKLSDYQIKRLIDLEIENVILLDDPDAVNVSKEHAFELNQYFNTKVGFCPEGKDPGEITFEELQNIIIKLETPIEFRINKLEKHQL